MCAKVKIIFRNNECYALFNGFSYQIDCKDVDEIVSKIRKYSEEYRRYNENVIREAAALGVIIIPTTTYGGNLFQNILESKVKKLLDQKAINKYKSLSSYY